MNKDHHDVELMRCIGSPECGNTGCYHFNDDHERYPERLHPDADYCVGSCGGNAVCVPVEPPEPMPREEYK